MTEFIAVAVTLLLIVGEYKVFCCMASTPTSAPTASPTGCTSCTKSQLEVTMAGVGAKAFAIDEITAGPDGCTIRQFTCNGNEADSNVHIEYNLGLNGTMPGVGTVSDTVYCNANGQWEKRDTPLGVLIVKQIECASV